MNIPSMSRCVMAINSMQFLLLASLLLANAKGVDAPGMEDEPPPIFALAPNIESDEQLIQSIRHLGDCRDESALPVLVRLLKQFPRHTEAGGVDGHSIRQDIVEAMAKIGGGKVRDFMRDFVSKYLLQGSFSGNPQEPFQDHEYGWAMTVGFRFLNEYADPGMEKWFADIATNQELHPDIQEYACVGFLKTKMQNLGLKTVEERVRWLLADLSSPGWGEQWDFYHHPMNDREPYGKKDWAIRDAARCIVLGEQGVNALPLLEQEWKKLEGINPRTKEQQWRQYGVARAIGDVRDRADLPIPPCFRSIPENWREEWSAKEKEYEQELRAAKQRTLRP